MEVNTVDSFIQWWEDLQGKEVVREKIKINSFKNNTCMSLSTEIYFY